MSWGYGMRPEEHGGRSGERTRHPANSFRSVAALCVLRSAADVERPSQPPLALTSINNPITALRAVFSGDRCTQLCNRDASLFFLLNYNIYSPSSTHHLF